MNQRTHHISSAIFQHLIHIQSKITVHARVFTNAFYIQTYMHSSVSKMRGHSKVMHSLHIQHKKQRTITRKSKQSNCLCHKLIISCHKLVIECHKLVTTCHKLVITSHKLVMACHKLVLVYHKLVMTCYITKWS